MEVQRKEFFEPERILRDVQEKVKEAKHKGEPIDYLTFVPDGEPTLDANLGHGIKLLKKLGLKIAVITNSSLIWREDVRDELSEADWVSLKIDAWSRVVWRRVNRPHGFLGLDKILKGISEFARTFKGELTTETMLIQGINDHAEEIEKISDLIAKIAPKESYLAVPTRPPAEKWVRPPTASTINMAYQIFRGKSIPTGYLIGYEGNAFAFTGNVEEDLLSITAVHPMREDQVKKLLAKAGEGWAVVEELINEDRLMEVVYRGKKFYTRKLKHTSL
jgi:wyosine [tRNA(Phe)-imidazoG37] synthetase (radical SAM superfamily)